MRLYDTEYNYDAQFDVLRVSNLGATSGEPTGDYCSSEVYTITNEYNETTYVEIANFKKNYSLDEYSRYIESFEVLKELPEIHKRVLKDEKDGKSIV